MSSELKACLNPGGHNYQPLDANTIFCASCGDAKNLGAASREPTSPPPIPVEPSRAPPREVPFSAHDLPLDMDLATSASASYRDLDGFDIPYQCAEVNEAKFMAEWIELCQPNWSAATSRKYSKLYHARSQELLLGHKVRHTEEQRNYCAFMRWLIRYGGILPKELKFMTLRELPVYRIVITALVRRNGPSWASRVEDIIRDRFRNKYYPKNSKKKKKKKKNSSGPKRGKDGFDDDTGLPTEVTSQFPLVQDILMTLARSEAAGKINPMIPPNEAKFGSSRDTDLSHTNTIPEKWIVLTSDEEADGLDPAVQRMLDKVDRNVSYCFLCE